MPFGQDTGDWIKFDVGSGAYTFELTGSKN